MGANAVTIGLLQGALDGSEDLDGNLRLSLFFRRAAAAGNALRVSETLAHGLRRELVELESLDSINSQAVARVNDSKAARNKPLVAGARALNNLEHTRAELLDSRDMRRKDTKVTSRGRHVDLGHLRAIVNGLVSKRRTSWGRTKLSLSLSLTASA